MAIQISKHYLVIILSEYLQELWELEKSVYDTWPLGVYGPKEGADIIKWLQNKLAVVIVRTQVIKNSEDLGVHLGPIRGCSWKQNCWSCGDSVLNLLMNRPTVFQGLPAVSEDSDFYTFLPIPNQYFFSFNYSYPSGCEEVSHCGFDLRFPSDCWCWASFRVLLEHLCIFGEMSLKSFAYFSIWLFEQQILKCYTGKVDFNQ